MPRKSNQKMRKRPSTRNVRASLHPPQLATNVTFRHRFRFISTSATATAITPTSLLGACGAMATVLNTSVATLSSSIKVDHVSLWTPPASQGASATCSINFLGLGNTPSREFSDTTVSVAEPAFVSCKPPPQSLASFWQVPSNTTMFTLVAPVGTIIDINVNVILADGTDNTSIIVATAALGSVYYLSLDPVATHRYTPVSLTTTF